MEMRELMLPEVLLAVFSMVMGAWLEVRRLLGAEVIVLAAATYGHLFIFPRGNPPSRTFHTRGWLCADDQRVTLLVSPWAVRARDRTQAWPPSYSVIHPCLPAPSW
jgi:hypothetical protein